MSRGPEKWYGNLHWEPYHLKKWYGFGRVCRIGSGANAVYASAMKYSASLTSAMCKKDVQGQCCVTWLTTQVQTQLFCCLMGEEILSTFSSVDISSAEVWHCLIGWLLHPVNFCVLFSISFDRFKKFSTVFFQVLADNSLFNFLYHNLFNNINF